MELLQQIISFILHIDVHLAAIVEQYGAWTYAVLTLIIFCETGLVVTPFLPGDSLLFATGALSANAALDIWLLFFLLTAAAIVGDAVNYWAGKYIGMKLFDGRIPYLKPAHLARTHAFYEKYGGKTIVIARFVPIVRENFGLVVIAIIILSILPAVVEVLKARVASRREASV